MILIKKIASILLRLGTSAILLVFLFKFKKIDLYSVFESLKNADKPLLFLAFAIFLLNYALCLYRWQILLKAAEIHLPIKRVIVSFCGGLFFNLFLPSSIGGDFARSIDLANHTKRPREVVGTVFLDRLSGYCGLAAVALVSLLLGWGLISDSKGIIFSLAVIIAVLIAALLLLFNNFIFSRVNRLLYSPNAGRIREALTNLHQEIYLFRNKKKTIFYNLFVSILVQSLTPVGFYLSALSVGIKANILYFFIFIPMIGAITLLPVSIGGLGLRENATVFFFARAGVNEHLSLLVSLLGFSFILAIGLIAGLVYALMARHKRKS